MARSVARLVAVAVARVVAVAVAFAVVVADEEQLRLVNGTN